MRYSNNGGQAKLCVELVPKKKKLGDAGMKRAVELAKGIPKDPDKALLWTAQIMAGLLPPSHRALTMNGSRTVLISRSRAVSKCALFLPFPRLSPASMFLS